MPRSYDVWKRSRTDRRSSPAFGSVSVTPSVENLSSCRVILSARRGTAAPSSDQTVSPGASAVSCAKAVEPKYVHERHLGSAAARRIELCVSGGWGDVFGLFPIDMLCSSAVKAFWNTIQIMHEE